LSAWALWALGYPDTAVARVGASLDRAEACEHPHTQAYVSYYAAVVHALRGDAAPAKRHAERCLTLSQQHGFRQWLGPAGIVCDSATSVRDPALAPVEDVRRRLAEYRRTGSQLGVTVLCAIVGEALAQREHFDALRDIVVEGLATMDRTSERFLEAELYRLKACALLGGGGRDLADEAQSSLEAAVASARRQDARTLELRAARDLAQLWRDQGKVQQARELLAPVYGWFTEGFDTRDLKEAKALLEELT
jgi:predicted ATPase